MSEFNIKVNKLVDRIELIKVLYQAIDDECKESSKKAPDYISEEEWIVAFDVFKAHYLANNMMDRYLNFMYWYIRICTYYAECYDKDHISELFAKVCRGSGTLDNIENVLRFREGETICLEIDEKLKMIRECKKGKKYIKQ